LEEWSGDDTHGTLGCTVLGVYADETVGWKGDNPSPASELFQHLGEPKISAVDRTSECSVGFPFEAVPRARP